MTIATAGQMAANRHLFNPAAEDIPQAMSIRFNQMAHERKLAGQDMIVLSLGEAFFDIPLFGFEGIDHVKGYHYSESQGLPELREKIANYYGERYGARVNADTEVLISAGSKALIYMSMLAIVQPGEEVAMHEPCWLSYQEQARLCGAKPLFVPHDAAVETFERFLSPRTRMLILNNPNNPAGRVYTRKELAVVADLCESRGIYLLVDEAYSDFLTDDSFVSIRTVAPDNKHVIIINSLSKNMGMSGWRIGYVIADHALIQVILKINQHVITCAPTFLLLYCAKHFERILEVTLPQARAVVEKRARVAEEMALLGLKALPGSATFYFFVSLGDYPGTSMDCAMELMERHGVSVVPGFAYGKSMDRFIRVSIGTEPMGRIRKGLVRIKDVIAQTRASGVVFTSEQAMEAQETMDSATASTKKLSVRKRAVRRGGRRTKSVQEVG